MGKRLTLEDRKKIDELDEQGNEPPEIATAIKRDTRTVKRYLKVRVREQSVKLEKQQQELEHRNDIQCRIGNLKKRLEFPSPIYLWVPDNHKTGKPVTKVGISLYGDTIEWQTDSNGYVITLDEKFEPVIEHLHSSRRGAILDELNYWKRVGGRCIEGCYKLRLYIEREAKERTSLSIVPDTGQRGLLDGFVISIYWSIFSSEGAKQDAYKRVSKRGDLYLLNYASYNLAWLQGHEIDRVKDIHQRLIRTCQNLSITIQVRQAIAELSQITNSLHQRLGDFASLKILLGKCHLCLGDESLS